MGKNVFAELDILKLTMSAEFATPIHFTTESTVFVIMDIMVMLINVKNVMKVVVNAQVLMQINVFHVLM